MSVIGAVQTVRSQDLNNTVPVATDSLERNFFVCTKIFHRVILQIRHILINRLCACGFLWRVFETGRKKQQEAPGRIQEQLHDRSVFHCCFVGVPNNLINHKSSICNRSSAIGIHHSKFAIRSILLELIAFSNCYSVDRRPSLTFDLFCQEKDDCRLLIAGY